YQRFKHRPQFLADSSSRHAPHDTVCLAPCPVVLAALKVLAHYPVEEPHTWTATIKHTLRHQESDVIVLTGGPDGGDWRTA
ncbi:hypothetical protein ACQUKJ_24300, partial [Ralstonia pseudosolanacearum]